MGPLMISVGVHLRTLNAELTRHNATVQLRKKKKASAMPVTRAGNKRQEREKKRHVPEKVSRTIIHVSQANTRHRPRWLAVTIAMALGLVASFLMVVGFQGTTIASGCTPIAMLAAPNMTPCSDG
jgi:hypothetical protein